MRFVELWGRRVPVPEFLLPHCQCTWHGWDHTLGVSHSRFCDMLMFY